MTQEKTPMRGRPIGSGAPESDAVRQVRHSLGWTQEQLARELGCSLSAIRTMEREGRLPGQSNLRNAFERLAEPCGVRLKTEKAEEL